MTIEETGLSHQVWSHGDSTLKKGLKGHKTAKIPNTLYIDDLRIDDWSSILRSSILSVPTIYIDDPIQ